MFRKIRRKIVRFALVSGAGAAASYFFDKDRGVERREQAKAKAASLMGRETPATDWRSTSANGFDTPGTVSVATPEPSVPTVTDILGPAEAEPEVDVLVVEPVPQNGAVRTV